MIIPKDLSKLCKTKEQKELWAKIEQAQSVMQDNNKKYKSLNKELKELTKKTNSKLDDLREQYDSNLLAGKIRAEQIKYKKKVKEIKTYYKEIPKLTHELSFKYEDMRNELIKMLNIEQPKSMEKAIEDLRSKGVKVNKWKLGL